MVHRPGYLDILIIVLFSPAAFRILKKIKILKIKKIFKKTQKKTFPCTTYITRNTNCCHSRSPLDVLTWVKVIKN
jgi:hypothetical protein